MVLLKLNIRMVINFKEIWKMDKELVKANIFIKTEIYMKVNLVIIKLMELEN